jgi:hypothetical protein
MLVAVKIESVAVPFKDFRHSFRLQKSSVKGDWFSIPFEWSVELRLASLLVALHNSRRCGRL